VIVVVGNPAWRPSAPAVPAGRAADIAVAAAGRGARVELVGRTGDDPAGDALMVALSAAGVGHVAVLRDPARPTLVVEDGPDQPADDEMLLEPAGRDDQRGPVATSPPDQAPQLEPEDVALGLQYLTAFDVIVVTDGTPGSVIPVAADAAAFAGAHLVVLVPSVGHDPASLPATATVLAAPAGPDDGAFAAVVGAYAAELDRGADPGAAFAAAMQGAGWEALEPLG
jgi:sugar/nucleoside kinase (ribokinase family)